MRRIILIIISAFGILLGSNLLNTNTVAAAEVLNAVAKNDNVAVISEIANAPKEVRRELLCLALNIYHEARGSSVRDQMAVALVTFNRLSSQTLETQERTICSVVFEKTYRKVEDFNQKGLPITKTVTTSQFSWTAYSVDRQIPSEAESWLFAQKLSYFMFRNQGTIPDFTMGATHYYAPDTLRKMGLPTPAWAKRGLNKQRIGGHVYMRLASYNK